MRFERSAFGMLRSGNAGMHKPLSGAKDTVRTVGVSIESANMHPREVQKPE